MLRNSAAKLLRAMSMIVEIEERKGREAIMMTMRKRRSSGTSCSQRLRQYASELLRAMYMIVAIEERKGRDSNYDEQEKI